MRSAVLARSRAAVAAALLAAAATTTLGPSVAHAAAGDLDTGFGDGGRRSVDVAGCEDTANDVAQAPGGGLVAAGSSCRESDFSYAATVVRLTPAGARDTSFGGDGVVSLADGAPAGDETSEFRAVVVSASGDAIYAAGAVANEATASDDLLLVKFSPTGAELGRYTAHVGATGSVDRLEDLRVDPATGAISAVGTSCSIDEVSDTCSVVAVRLTSSLEPDPAFDTDGVATSATGFYAVVHLLPDGRVAAIDHDVATDADRVRLFTPTLTADPVFAPASGGARTLPFYALGLTSTPTHLFVAGEAYDDVNSNQALAKLHLNGSFDTSFSGPDGIAFTDLGGDEFAREVAVDPQDGSVYTAGGHNDLTVSTLARFTPSGALDVRFGEGGSVRLGVPGYGGSTIESLIVQADRKPVTAGSAFVESSGEQDMTFARFKATTPHPPRYTPVTPARILDTRAGRLAGDGRDVPLGAGQFYDLGVLGRGGVPATGVSAVVLNVTAIAPTTTGALTVYPTGSSFPGTSNVHFVAKQLVANLATVKVGDGGKVRVYNSAGTTHVAVDVAGWYSSGDTAIPGGKFKPLPPKRLLDSRPGKTPTTEGVNTKLTAGKVITLKVTGVGGVPTTATAVVLNLTVANASGPSYLTAYPSGAAVPVVSNINFTTNQVIANLAVVKVGTGGTIKIKNAFNTTHAIADVSGYFTGAASGSDGSFQPYAPRRVFDTRVGLGTAQTKLAPNTSRVVQITGRGGIPPTGVTSVAVHVLAVNGTVNGGYLTVYPDGITRPTASNVNLYANRTAGNAVMVKLGTGGRIRVYNYSGTTNVVVDVVGWYN